MGALLKVEMLDEADIVPEFPTALFHYTFFIKLVFGMSGMELKDVKMVMVQSMEEELHRKTLELRKAGKGKHLKIWRER